ncbi:MAG: SurA N-terminal domain-containing protein [Candidatus Omnitrophica bacterium]|nr:SurA N-terminal domain-containing protein [Candidatus Omnitrophota bacterium]
MFKRLIVSHRMRRRVSWLIAAILILPFIFFFHATGRAPSRGPGGTAGIVFGKPIDWDTFQDERRSVQRQFEEQFAAQFDALGELLQPMITGAAWDRLIVLEEARRRRLQVDDAEVAASIRQLPELQEEGRFHPERYHRLLQLSGTTPQAFESRIRRGLLIEKLVSSIRNAVTVSDEEVRAAYRKAREARTASLVLFDPAAAAEEAAAALTEEELRAAYGAQLDTLRVPEQLRLEYAGLTREEMSASLQLTDEDIRGFYDTHPDQFARSDGTLKPYEEVREEARRQLLEERARQRLATLAVDLEEDLKVPLRFEEIIAARGLSRHAAGPFPAGASHAAGVPDPAILQATEGLAEGRVSGVIDTGSAVYLARITQRLPPRLPPFEEARGEVRSTLIRERARAKVRADAEAFRNRVANEPRLRFEEAALAAGIAPMPVEVRRGQPFDPIGYQEALNEAAFAVPLGGLTEVFDTPRGFALLRPETHLPADESLFAEEAQTFRPQVETERRNARLAEWLEEVRARAKLRSFVED